MQKEIRLAWSFDQSPNEVWDYLTKPELVEQWLGKADIQPVIGHKFQLLGKSGCLTFCEVLEVKPFSRFSYSWRYPAEKDRTLFDSMVVWTLAEKENGTELQLVHTGIVAMEDHTTHSNGWAILGSRLVNLLNVVVK